MNKPNIEFKSPVDELVYYLSNATPEQLKKFVSDPQVKEIIGADVCESVERSLQ